MGKKKMTDSPCNHDRRCQIDETDEIGDWLDFGPGLELDLSDRNQ